MASINLSGDFLGLAKGGGGATFEVGRAGEDDEAGGVAEIGEDGVTGAAVEKGAADETGETAVATKGGDDVFVEPIDAELGAVKAECDEVGIVEAGGA